MDKMEHTIIIEKITPLPEENETQVDLRIEYSWGNVKPYTIFFDGIRSDADTTEETRERVLGIMENDIDAYKNSLDQTISIRSIKITL